jgi:hypothetical protein
MKLAENERMAIAAPCATLIDSTDDDAILYVYDGADDTDTGADTYPLSHATVLRALRIVATLDGLTDDQRDMLLSNVRFDIEDADEDWRREAHETLARALEATR